MRVWVVFCLVLMPFLGLAKSTLPKGCKAIAVQGESVSIQAKKNKLVFMHNITSNDLWITHPVVDTGASAGWSSRLQAGNWSALVVDKGPFVIECIESRPGHEQQIPCEEALAVCQWKGAKMPADGKGVYWAKEDKSLPELTAAMGGRGFVLPNLK
ncbi:MAG: hypothetical protein ACHP6H_01345 [Legionellales bacterium]